MANANNEERFESSISTLVNDEQIEGKRKDVLGSYKISRGCYCDSLVNEWGDGTVCCHLVVSSLFVVLSLSFLSWSHILALYVLLYLSVFLAPY